MSDIATGKIIPLTKGFFAIVDEEDFPRVSQFRWHWSGGYAKRTVTMPDGKRRDQYLARFIMGEPPEMWVDHRSQNRLDNRKENLRTSTRNQNYWNTGKRVNNSSGFKGVTWHKRSQRWRARISANGKRYHLGDFTQRDAASRAYKEASQRLHGEFGRTEALEHPSQISSAPEKRPLGIRNTSGIEGVCWTKADKRWAARIAIDKRQLFIGHFKTKEEAGLARKKAEQVLPSLNSQTVTGGLLRSAIAQYADS